MNNKTIFRQGSKTFYTASLFFPQPVRENVIRLYAFVRTADDFVDMLPQDKKGFMHYKNQTKLAFKGKYTPNAIIRDFVSLSHECTIETSWVDAFLGAMELDLTKKKYKTYKELEVYMYGSAEVIGLMMARIMKLTPRAENAARLQGKAMQLINFIRDVQEDYDLGRQYLPQEDLERFGIKKLSPDVDPEAFSKLVRYEIERYMKIQRAARKGYRYLPRKNRIPIETAAAAYEWTAREIMKNPMSVFEKKIKPAGSRIVLEYLRQFLSI